MKTGVKLQGQQGSGNRFRHKHEVSDAVTSRKAESRKLKLKLKPEVQASNVQFVLRSESEIKDVFAAVEERWDSSQHVSGDVRDAVP
ncbi:MAG: hypothetical protein ACO3PV_07960 [Pseudohongiellaceae bacterium]